MTYTNKDVYSGEWKGGKKNGYGTYILLDWNEVCRAILEWLDGRRTVEIP